MANKIPILMYHEVYQEAEYEQLKKLTNPAYNISLPFFCRQIEWLRSKGIRTLTVDEIVAGDLPQEDAAICLTFDDGWRGNYTNAFPILKKLSVKATFFVATDLIDKEHYMSWEQLKDMHESGMSIQSHGVSHAPLGDMERNRILYELKTSKDLIEKKLNSDVNSISLPHGHYDSNFWPIAESLGYKAVCTSDVGFHTYGSFSPWLSRISIGDGITHEQFCRIALAKPAAIRKAALIKNLKTFLKRIVGINNYRRLYRLVYQLKD